MNIFPPPQTLLDALPEQARTFLENGGWNWVLGVGALLGFLLLAFIVVKALKPARRKKKDDGNELQINLQAIPKPQPSSGDRQLRIEGVPVRLRLVVLAPAGKSQTIERGKVWEILDRVVGGLGDIGKRDQPEVYIWPVQLSDEGFANTFHRNTPLPEGEDEPSRWVMVAGRAHLGTSPIFLGLGLQAVKPTTVGRKRFSMHEWTTELRIRTKD